ncbi:swr complex subunit [Dimargaris xerosporica]|nr:swr complex subunit [Dimargaris xerosporica]
MSHSDALDILGVERSAASPATKRVKVATASQRAKKPEGVSRELYSLIGGAPSVVISKPAFKAKPKLATQATHWVWRGFTSSARQDDLVLYHWTKSTDDPLDYFFASFNQSIDVVTYTDAEYDLYLKDDHWTKAETDYLVELCRTYDLRFVVIADRFDFDDHTHSVDDIKERYYAIQQRLLRARHQGGMDDPDLRRQLALYDFNKDREVERKSYLEAMYSRTLAQIQEEEALFVEARRLEQNEKRLMQERQTILRLLNAHETNLAIRYAALKARRSQATALQLNTRSVPPSPDTSLSSPAGLVPNRDDGLFVGSEGSTPDPEYPSTHGGGATYKSRKRKLLKKNGRLLSVEPSTPRAAGGSPSRASTPGLKDLADQDLTTDLAYSPLITHLGTKDRQPPGAYIRSTRITPVKLSMSQKVLESLDELNVGKYRMQGAVLCLANLLFIFFR